MKRKNFILIAVVFLVVGLLLSSCGHHRHFSRHTPERMLRRIDGRIKNLDLTETQEAQYKEIRKRLENELKEDLKKYKDIPEQVSMSISEEDPDVEEMAEFIKMRLSETPALRGKYVDYFVEFYNILDEEQKQQVLDHIDRRMRRTRKYTREL